MLEAINLIFLYVGNFSFSCQRDLFVQNNYSMCTGVSGECATDLHLAIRTRTNTHTHKI